MEIITKICTKCGAEKSLNEFNKQSSNIDGLMYMCRECSINGKKEYYRTKHGLIIKLFGAQITRCKKKQRPFPTYDIKEFEQWVYSQDNFNILYDNWVKSGFKKMLTPSVDRIDNQKFYDINNIRLMTWNENKTLGHIDMRKGNITHGIYPQKKVLQFDKDMNLINEFISTREAERQTKISHQSIINVCKNKKHCKSAGGFIWRYKNE